MHVRLVRSKGDLPLEWLEHCIMLEKNIGPLTKAMIHGGSFSFGHISSISYEKINFCYMLMHKEESIVCCLCCPGMDV